MAKRQASNQLTQETWEDEDEVVDEAGVFTPADDSQLKERVIRKAKRSFTSTGTPTSAFSGFSGFSSKSSPFVISNNATTSNGQKITSHNSLKPAMNSNILEDKDTEYYHNIKELNSNVLKWLEDHHSKNNYCDFTPVFKDYEKHLNNLRGKYGQNLSEKNSFNVLAKSTSNAPTTAKDSPAKFSFYTTTSQSKPTTTGGFSLGLLNNSTTQPSSTTGGFSFGLASQSSDNQTNSSLFSFGVANAMAKQKENAQEINATETKDDDNYEPPKNEVKLVEESDAFYSKRCKLFYKKDADYVEKGVGLLYLKKLEDKTQLLIRAETSLGNILLNIVLSSKLPVNKMGKNNVLIVCIPNPPLNTKETAQPTPMLIRVKTSEEADELMEKINEYKC